MKHLKLFFYALALAMSFTACGGDDDDITDNGGDATPVTDRDNLNANVSKLEVTKRLEFPHVNDGERILVNRTSDIRINPSGINYCVRWDDALKCQRYSCYQMCESFKQQNTTRYYDKDNQYPRDTRIPDAAQFPFDPFWNSGYDHGHIVPSADRLYSYQANYQTFLLSNMMPQVNGFNAGVWSNMEQQVRDWSRNSFCDTLYVVKGGTIAPTADCPDAVRDTRVSGWIIPKYYYMALLCKNSNGYKTLGFFIEHKASSDTDLGKYVINIDELEKKTGLDFFCNLPDSEENRIEGLPVENLKRAWGLK